MFSDDDQLIGNPTLDQTIEKNGINDSLSTPGTSKVQPTFDAFQQCHLDGHEVDKVDKICKIQPCLIRMLAGVSILNQVAILETIFAYKLQGFCHTS